jgi:hypothetical protein
MLGRLIVDNRTNDPHVIDAGLYSGKGGIAYVYSLLKFPPGNDLRSEGRAARIWPAPADGGIHWFSTSQSQYIQYPASVYPPTQLQRCGFFYQHFDMIVQPPWTKDQVRGWRLFRIAAPYWSVFTAMMVWPTIFALWRIRKLIQARIRMKRMRQNLCPFCGYDIRATPIRCPECGGIIAPSVAGNIYPSKV